MSEEQLTKDCTVCGRVLVISPEDVVITCRYCGSTFDVEGKKVPHHQMLPTLKEKAIRDSFLKFLRKNQGVIRGLDEKAVVEEVKLNYVPYWVCPFNSHTHYFGVKQSSVTRTRVVSDGRGGTRTETYTVPIYRPEEGDFSRAGREKIIARKHTAFYGFENFQKKLDLKNVQEFDFSKIKDLEADFINAEIDAQEAAREAYGTVENENRRIADSRVNRLVRCDSQIQIGEPLYVHAPLWQIRYTFKNKVYKVSIIGDSGAICKGEIPLTLGRRAFNYAAGLLTLVAGAFVGQYGLSLLSDILNTNSWLGYLLIFAGAITAAMSFIFMRTAFKMQLEKSD
ncbi:MAG: hypothetical protein QXG44_09650 [Candidatus Jordarchaeaceae archaeon]